MNKGFFQTLVVTVVLALVAIAALATVSSSASLLPTVPTLSTPTVQAPPPPSLPLPLPGGGGGGGGGGSGSGSVPSLPLPLLGGGGGGGSGGGGGGGQPPGGGGGSGGGGGGGQPSGGGGSPPPPPPPPPGPSREGQSPSGQPMRNPDGSPTPWNPGFSSASPFPVPLTPIPGFEISQFAIPPFLLPIYQAAGIQDSIPWEVLASINEIETNFGRNLNVSSAGAVGWMQFMPDTWAIYGVDATQTGVKDPYNPVDAIFAASRYLKAAGGDKNINQGIFAYNHAQWYVDQVMTRARIFMGMPGDLVGALTGMTEGHFPVFANSHYADDPNELGLIQHGAGAPQTKPASNPKPGSSTSSSNDTRQAVDVFSDSGAPVVAVNAGQVEDMGENPQLGKFIVLQDLYGNHYTYGGLGDIVPMTPQAQGGPPPPPGTQPATLQTPSNSGPRQIGKDRLFADPSRPGSYAAGGDKQLLAANPGGQPGNAADYFPAGFQPPNAQGLTLQPLQKGSQIMYGAILGHLGKVDPNTAPHVHFQIKPAGDGAPQIDPKPILDGWELSQATSIYRADGKNILADNDINTFGSVLLMPQQDLENKVLSDGRIGIYPCGRNDIQTHQIDRRVLGMLEFLADSGLNPTVSTLKCGHSFLTSAGNVSAHSFGAAADISQINGIPIQGNQQPGSITETTIRKLMTLQGTLRPQQIISLMDLGQPSFAMSDHYDHIHVGYSFGTSPSKFAALDPNQWNKLSTALAGIQNPSVFAGPSPAAKPDEQ